MSRSFRQSDQFADSRATFAERKSAREARVREFAAMGYDEAEILASLPLRSAAQRERALRLLNR